MYIPSIMICAGVTVNGDLRARASLEGKGGMSGDRPWERLGHTGPASGCPSKHTDGDHQFGYHVPPLTACPLRWHYGRVDG